MESKQLYHPVVHPLSQYKLIIFDSDGTLSRCTVEGQPCPNKPGEWELMPNVKETLAQYVWAEYDDIRDIGPPAETFWIGAICSNQGGVGLGFFSFEEAHGLMVDRAIAAGILHENTDRHKFNFQVQFCPHAPVVGCYCRIPSPFLYMAIANALNVVWRKDVLVVGDHHTDLRAARAAGFDFCHAGDFFCWRMSLEEQPDMTSIFGNRSR